MEREPPIRVLLCDDRALFRAALCSLLQAETDLQVVEEAADGREAAQVAQHVRPDVVLMDIAAPGTSELAATGAFTETCPDVKIVVIANRVCPRYLQRAQRIGARAYLLKRESGSVLMRTIRHIVAGDHLFTSEAVRALSADFERQALERLPATSSASLRQRERDLIRLVATGASNREIARALDVTEKTIRNHLWEISSALGLRNRTEVVLHALRSDVITLEETRKHADPEAERTSGQLEPPE